jgi:hypothetical protein
VGRKVAVKTNAVECCWAGTPRASLPTVSRSRPTTRAEAVDYFDGGPGPGGGLCAGK